MNCKYKRELLNYHYIRPIVVARDTEAIILNESLQSISQSCGPFPRRAFENVITGEIFADHFAACRYLTSILPFH